jgi:multimeric flavodoxin WrbA
VSWASYWFTITAQLKAFLDRCYGLGSDITMVEEHGLAGKLMARHL